MTQKNAIEEALRMLGGRAHTSDIYVVAMQLGDFSGSQQPKNTIRNCLQTNPSTFRPSPGKGKGWWELLSFQEEMHGKDKIIAELQAEVERLKMRPTEDDFVKRFVAATKVQFRFKRQEADAVRQIMDKLGRSDAEAVLGSWIEGKEIMEMSRPYVKVEGDMVIEKNVEHHVGKVAS